MIKIIRNLFLFFKMQVENNEKLYNKSQLNRMIDNKLNFYYSLLDQGFYLPSPTSRSITFEWLWKIFSRESFSL